MKSHKVCRFDGVANAYEIMDRISFQLTTGEETEWFAVKNEPDGTIFITVDCLRDPRPMQEDGDFTNGYEQSDLRRALNTEILETIPGEVRELMVPFRNGDLLRIPTEKEIFGNNEYGVEEPEDVEQFAPMVLKRNRVAFAGFNGDWQYWWTQNRRRDSASDACNVGTNGDASYSSASTSIGVRPLLKLGTPVPMSEIE